MTLSGSLAARRLGVAVSALTLGIGVATPVYSAPAKDKTDCIEYGEVAEAPAGFIPRDDLHTVHKDPLARALKSVTSAKGRGGKAGDAAAEEFAGATIPVRFNVVYKDNGQGGGNLSDARINEQIQVLNDAYSGTGFTFVLAEINRKAQPQWFNLVSANGELPRFYRGSGKEVKMKQFFYEDSTSETLNIYTASLAQSLLGWAYFPSFFDPEASEGNPLPSYLDGVVLDFRSLPAVDGDTGDTARYPEYGEGDTATHEVGHWLQLYHTFQGGCTEPGDSVDDTAAEASPAFECPTGRDTCTSPDVDPGVDPIHNFMDYTYDECMYEFTPGQATRMQMAWTTFRDIS